jgi:hypothetical protein
MELQSSALTVAALTLIALACYLAGRILIQFIRLCIGLRRK